MVDGRIAKASQPIESGQTVTLFPEAPLPAAQSAPTIGNAMRVLLQRDDLIVLDKPAGIHSHCGKSSDSAAAFMVRRFGASQNEIGKAGIEAGVAHRLDRDTSGVLLAATSTTCFNQLRSAFREHRVRKHYLALVWGCCAPRLHCDLPLSRRASRVVLARRHDRRLHAETLVETVEVGDHWSLVQAETATGAPHQIRVHLAALGHPLVGDTLYGGAAIDSATRKGHMLHAQRIQTQISSESDEPIDVTAAVPSDFLATLARLRT